MKRIEKKIINGKKVKEGFSYSSETNSSWLDKNFFKKWLRKFLQNGQNIQNLFYY